MRLTDIRHPHPISDLKTTCWSSLIDANELNDASVRLACIKDSDVRDVFGFGLKHSEYGVPMAIYVIGAVSEWMYDAYGVVYCMKRGVSGW